MTRNIGLLAQISYILCQLLVCSGKSQLSNYVNAHCLQISTWTWFMSIYRGSPSVLLHFLVDLQE